MNPLLLHGNTNQYNINGYFVLTPRCFAYRHAATTFYQLQRGFGGKRQHARIQEFLSVLFSPQLILQFTEGVQWFYCWENYTYTLPRIQRGGPLFSRGGGVKLFPGGGGSNAYFFRNPCTPLLFSRGGGVRTPYPPLDPHMGNVGAQWLSGRVLDSRLKGHGFEPHRRHCVVVLEQDTFILA